MNYSSNIWILVKCDIVCDIASLRYLSDISCDIFFIAFAISFISYAIFNNVAYDISLRYRMRYPYDAISYISHAISLCDIVCDIVCDTFAIAYDIAVRYRMLYPYDAISFISNKMSHCYIVCDIFAIAYDIAVRYLMRYPYDAISHSISHAIIS